MSYLSDHEKQSIEAFCNNKVMFNAVKKVLLSGIYEQGTLKEGEEPNPKENMAFHLASLAIKNPIPDELLGQHIRGMWAGVNALEVGFDKLETFKQVKKGKEKPNPAV